NQNAGPGMIVGIALYDYGAADPIDQVRRNDSMFGNSVQRVVGSPPVAEFDKPANSVERTAQIPLLRRLPLAPAVGAPPPQPIPQIPRRVALLHLRHILRCALRHDPPAAVAALGAHIQNPVRRLDD